MGLWRRFSLVLFLPVAAMLLVFTLIVSCWFSRPLWNWGRVMGIEPQTTLFLPRFSLLFPKKYISWIAANPCLISRVLKRLTIFVNVLGAFMEERNFGGSYSTIFADVTVFCVFKGFAWWSWLPWWTRKRWRKGKNFKKSRELLLFWLAQYFSSQL